MSEVLVFGEALIDLVPDLSGDSPSFQPLLGGSPYNVAIGLARLGGQVSFLGRLSSDPNGEIQYQRLATEGVGLSAVQRGGEFLH